MITRRSEGHCSSIESRRAWSISVRTFAALVVLFGSWFASGVSNVEARLLVDFNQCSCKNGVFPLSGTSSFSLTQFTLPAATIGCPAGVAGTVDATFPGRHGAAFNFVGSTTGKFSANVAPSLVNNAAGDGPGSWFMLFKIDIDSIVSTAVTLYDMHFTDLTSVSKVTVRRLGSTSEIEFSSTNLIGSGGATEAVTNSFTFSAGSTVNVMFGHSPNLRHFICIEGVATPCTQTGQGRTGPTFDPTGNAIPFSLDVLVKAVTTSVDFSGRLHTLVLSNEGIGAVASDLTNLASFFADTLASVSAPLSVPIPLNTGPVFSGDEEDIVPVQLTAANAFSNLQATDQNVITFAVTAGSGSFNDFNIDGAHGEANFTPVSHANGALDQLYTLSVNGCVSPQGHFTINLAPVNDRPLVVDPSNGGTTKTEVFASVNFLSTSAAPALTVMDDVESTSGTALITSELPSNGVLHSTTGCNSQVIDSNKVLNIVNSRIVFCFVPDSTMVNGKTSEFTFQVKDDDATDSLISVGSGRIIFVGANPLELQSATLSANEGGSKSFTFTELGRNRGGVSSTDFSVVLTALPNPGQGSLTVNGNTAALATTYASSSSVVFTPAPQYFNQRGTSGLDLLGQPITADCSASGGCGATFQYKLTKDQLESAVGTQSVFVKAVDNGVATIAAPEVVSILGNTATPIKDLSVTSDNGANVFDIQMKLSSSPSVDFKVDLSVASKAHADGKPISQHIVNVESKDCQAFFCTEFLVQGPPAILTELLKTVQARLLTSVKTDSSPLMIYEVFVLSEASGDFEKSDGKSTSVTLRSPKTNFFDKEENIYIVGGGGGGALVIVLLGLAFLRSRSNTTISKETLLNVAEQAVDIELRGKGKRVADTATAPSKDAMDKKKSIKLNVDDEIFDWEKHIDKESGEVYFFNPKTGESQWDPPTVKNYNL